MSDKYDGFPSFACWSPGDFFKRIKNLILGMSVERRSLESQSIKELIQKNDQRTGSSNNRKSTPGSLALINARANAIRCHFGNSEAI
jgi:hypothetical protein